MLLTSDQFAWDTSHDYRHIDNHQKLWSFVLKSIPLVMTSSKRNSYSIDIRFISREEEEEKEEGKHHAYIHSTTERKSIALFFQIEFVSTIEIKHHHHDTTIESFSDHWKLFEYTNHYPMDDSVRNALI